MLRRFIDLNRRLCLLLDRIWPYPLASSFWSSYVERAGEAARTAAPPRVIDVGAGRETPYAMLVAGQPLELIGVDVIAEDMEANGTLTRRVVSDIVVDGLPADVHGAGLVTSRMVLEHIPDLDRFASEILAATAPGGRSIHLFAGRYSLFAVLNRLLPDEVSRRLLFALRPESAEVGGFVTYYDRTHPPAAEGVFRQAGFTDVHTDVSYQVSQYMHFFFPLFVVARIWETVVHRLQIASLGSFVLLTARRPD